MIFWSSISIRAAFFALTALSGLVANQVLAAGFEVIPGRESKPTIVLVTGELVFGDQKKFISKTLNLDSALVVFHSPGGNVLAGIEIGKAIRLKEFRTYVPKDMMCASACAVAWLGGTKRFMSRSARVGFHAAYRLEDGKASESGMANALIGGYLNSLGLSQNAIAFVTSAGPDSMKWLTQRDASAYGIEVALLDLDEKPAAQEESAPAATTASPNPAPPTSRDKYLSLLYGEIARNSPLSSEAGPGKVTVSFVVDSSGKVKKLTIDSATTQAHAEMVRETLRKVHMPPPPGGPIEVGQTFNFK